MVVVIVRYEDGLQLPLIVQVQARAQAARVESQSPINDQRRGLGAGNLRYVSSQNPDFHQPSSIRLAPYHRRSSVGPQKPLYHNGSFRANLA